VRTLAQDNGADRQPAAGAGTKITIEEVRENFRRAVEEGGNAATTVHITDMKTMTDLKNEVDNHDPVTIVGGPDGTVTIGAQAVSVDGVPTFVSDFMPNQDYAADTNPGGRNFLTVDLRFHAVYDLSSTVMEILGKRNDSDEFFLKRYSTMLQDAGAWEYTSLLTGLE
jgi:hypothetical protein